MIPSLNLFGFYILILVLHFNLFLVKTQEQETGPEQLETWSTTLSSSHPQFDDESIDNSNSLYLATNDSRQGRTFLSELGFLRPTLFNIVRFPNEECLDASNQSGTCYTALECKKLGGNPSSKCAKGLGTCCIMSRTCHNSTYNKVVYFKNPSYPLTDSEQNFCDLSVNIIDADICQLRIDFLEFQIDQPTSGNCFGDKFTVSGSGMTPNSVPVLCGNNRNQHMYVSLPPNLEKRSVSIVFETNSTGDYRFHLKITQIDCRVRQAPFNNNLLTTFSSATQLSRESRTIYQKIPNQLTYPAPTGCLQYFTQPTGTIESFNFGHYLNNLDYAICIERQPDTCRIIYTASDPNFGIDAAETIGDDKGGAGDELCKTAYILLTGGSLNGDGITKDRYCGNKLVYNSDLPNETPIVSKANGPIVIRFHSGDSILTKNREGFRIKYEQSPTDCAMSNSAIVNPLNINPFAPPMVVKMMLESGKNKPIKLPSSTSPLLYSSSQLEMKLDQSPKQISSIESKNEANSPPNESSSERINKVLQLKRRANGKRMDF